VGRSLRDLIAPGELQSVYAQNSLRIAAGEKLDVEVVRQRKDGSRFHAQLKASRVPLSEGVTAAYLIYHDISERKRAEEELQRQKAHLDELFELSPDAVVLTDLSHPWIIRVNKEFTRMFGYSAEEVVGKRLRSLIVPPGVPPAGLAENAELLAGHKVEKEVVRQRKDGTLFHAHVTAARVRLQYEADAAYVIYRDISERKLAEEELRRQKAYLDELFEVAPDAIVLTTLEPRTLRVNKKFTEMFGFTPEDVIGRRLRNFIAPGELSPEALTDVPALRAGQRVEREAVRQRKDGTRFHAHITSERVRLQGEENAAYVIYRDITERKRAEALLAGENRVLEMIAKGSSLTATLDALCRLMEQVFSGSIASIVLMGGDGCFRHGAAPSLPESYTAAFEGMAMTPQGGPCGAAASGRAQVVVADIETYAHSEKYRTIAAAHGLRACWSTPIFSSDDKVLGTFALYYRETCSPNAVEQSTIQHLSNLASIVIERTNAEEALRSSEERYALAMGAAGEGHWDWIVATDEYYCSPRMLELYGFSTGARFTGRADFLAQVPFHAEDRSKWEDAVAAHFAGATERFDQEMRILPRGETRWIHLSGNCTRDASGRPVRWTGSVTDVTDRKRVEQALRESERQLRQAQRLEAMGTLAGGIAHDFNNILGAILGYGEMALRDAAKGSRLRRDLDSIVSAGERGRALVDRILAFSRSGIGERIAVHVQNVVGEALDLISAKLPAGTTIEARLDAGSAAMLGDPTQVHQVLMNLAMNGLQAMSAGGVLRVSLRACRFDTPRVATIGSVDAGDYVVLEVEDGGTGIAPDVLDRIFDPFFTTKDVGVGTGLGLSLVHGIVTEVGGSIDVASRPGHGSIFTVYFPRHGDAADRAADELAAAPRGNRQHVLVVDDEEPLVDLATRTLEELGYVPVGFTSSGAALAAFRAEPQRFHAVITDERMPGLSGSALIREVRAIRSAIPILLMSGYVGGIVTSRAYNSGATEVLKKPLSTRELATSLARVLHPQ
jgi:PAS domain S-box-containing protein